MIYGLSVEIALDWLSDQRILYFDREGIRIDYKPARQTWELFDGGVSVMEKSQPCEVLERANRLMRERDEGAK